MQYCQPCISFGHMPGSTALEIRMPATIWFGGSGAGSCRSQGNILIIRTSSTSKMWTSGVQLMKTGGVEGSEGSPKGPRPDKSDGVCGEQHGWNQYGQVQPQTTVCCWPRVAAALFRRSRTSCRTSDWRARRSSVDNGRLLMLTRIPPCRAGCCRGSLGGADLSC